MMLRIILLFNTLVKTKNGIADHIVLFWSFIYLDYLIIKHDFISIPCEIVLNQVLNNNFHIWFVIFKFIISIILSNMLQENKIKYIKERAYILIILTITRLTLLCFDDIILNIENSFVFLRICFYFCVYAFLDFKHSQSFSNQTMFELLTEMCLNKLLFSNFLEMFIITKFILCKYDISSLFSQKQKEKEHIN
jgi:hypothetical protein